MRRKSPDSLRCAVLDSGKVLLGEAGVCAISMKVMSCDAKTHSMAMMRRRDMSTVLDWAGFPCAQAESSLPPSYHGLASSCWEEQSPFLRPGLPLSTCGQLL